VFDKGKKDDNRGAVASLIDADMRITGSVVSSGDIVLAGIVDGDINCRSLVVQDNATLSGSINTVETVIAGRVTGDIVSEKVQIQATAHFEGDLKCAGIEVQAGATITARFNKRKKTKAAD